MIFSASKSALGLKCLWWARPDSPRSDTTSEAAVEGRDRHAAIERALHAGESTNPYGRAVLSEWKKPEQFYTEIAFEFDCTTGMSRVIDAKNRSYERRDGCIYGTADVVAEYTNHVEIIDWKTGRSAPLAAENGQLLTLAVMARSALKITKPIFGEIAHVSPDGVTLDSAKIDEIEMDAHSHWLRNVPREIDESIPLRGAHCRQEYCPSFGLCPATNAGANLVAPTQLNRKLAITASDIRSAEQAAWQYQTLRQAQAAMAAAWSALTAYAEKNGGVDLSDGQKWGPSTTRRTQIAASPDALRVITGIVGPMHAGEAYSITITRAGIRAAARAKAAETDQSIAGIEQDIMSALDSVGAVSQNETTAYKEYKK